MKTNERLYTEKEAISKVREGFVFGSTKALLRREGIKPIIGSTGKFYNADEIDKLAADLRA
jgi:hypothetical protein